MLKGQDILLLLELAAHPDHAWRQSDLAEALGLSVGEVNKAIKRAEQNGLLVRAPLRVLRQPLLELLAHGVRYVFPAQLGSIRRGMPTGSSAAPLIDHIARASELPLVWPDPNGTARGESITPLYPSVPDAARADPKLHALLALIDSIRVGSARERAIAVELLAKELGVAESP